MGNLCSFFDSKVERAKQEYHLQHPKFHLKIPRHSTLRMCRCLANSVSSRRKAEASVWLDSCLKKETWTGWFGASCCTITYIYSLWVKHYETSYFANLNSDIFCWRFAISLCHIHGILPSPRPTVQPFQPSACPSLPLKIFREKKRRLKPNRNEKMRSKIKLDEFSKLKMKCKTKWLKLPTKSWFGVRMLKDHRENKGIGKERWGSCGAAEAKTKAFLFRTLSKSEPRTWNTWNCSRPSALVQSELISEWILWFLTPSHLSCLKKNPFRSPKITGISPHPAVHPAPTIQTL